MHFLRWIFVFVLCTAPLTAHCGSCQADSTNTLYCNQPGNPDSCNIGDYAAFTTGIGRCEFDGRWVEGYSDAPVLECVTLCKNLNNLLYMWVDDELYVYRRVYKERTVSPLSDFARCDKNKTNANFFLHNNNRDKSKSWYVTCSTEPVSTQTQPQNTSNKITINGVVKNRNGEVLSGALVEVSNTQKVKTDSNGKFKLNDVDKTKNVSISHDGCAIVGRKADTLQNATVELTCVASQPSGQSGSANPECGVIGKKECNTNYKICEKNGETRDCTGNMLLPHTTEGKCVTANRTGYKICISTKCEDNYEASQGFCKKKTQSAPSEESSQSGSADTIVMEGYCLNAEGDTGIDDIATNTYCWCSSHMTNAPRCRLSHVFLSEQTGVCTKSNNAATRKAACDSFCQGKAQTMLQICECEEAKERGEKPADTVCYDDGTPDIFTPESASDNCAQSGGVLDANGECVCEGENLEQSADKQTCVATQTNEPGADTPTEETQCGGGTLNADGTCNCDVDGANLTQSGDTCDCIDGYHRDTDTNKCIEGETPTDVNSPTATDPTSADSQRATTATPAKDPLKEAEDAYKKAKDNEQSLANRTLTAGTTLATGLGMMTAASAKAEQKADADAEQDMAAYLATFKCEYGRGQSVPSTGEEITLPGGNELVEYYQEYKTLADNLKNTKKALGLRAGIENEVVYDKAESNLYKYSSVGKNGGAYTSLSRALTDPEGEDAAAWNMQKEESAKKLKTGAIAAGGGIVGGIGGNALMNTDMIKNITSKFKGSGTDADTDSE